MNRFINSHIAFWSRGLLIATILFSLFMLPGNAKAQTKNFYLKFKEIRVFNILNENGSIVNERYDQNGGSIDVNVQGKAYELCPGGAETMRFTWQFAQTIATLTPASKVSASIEASQVSSSPPCTIGIAARSLVVMHGNNGVVSPFSGDESLKMEGLTKSEDGTRYWADPGSDPNAGVSAILVSEEASNGPEREFAWFEFFISTSGGDLRYVYLYDIVRGGSNPPPVGVTPANGVTPSGGDNGQTITWNTTASSVRGQNGQQFTFICPPGGRPDSRIWGTDLYTDDSSICVAAVHAGLITAANGGKVTIQVQPGASSFTGSTRNGVTSAGWGAYPGGFTFVGGPSTTPPEPIPPLTGAKSPPCIWTGIWENPSWGKVTLNQNGSQIIGVYDHYIGPILGSGQLSGTISGNKIDGQWTQTQPKGNGTFQFILGEHCNIAGGTWSYGNGTTNPGTIGTIGQPNTNVTNMTIQVARRQVITGELVMVPVWLIKANNVANLNFEITFNAGIAKPEGTLTKGNLLDNVLFSANPNQSGKILSGFAGTTGISGTGTVLNIPFRAVGKPGDRTILEVTVTTINDPSGTTLQIDRIAGEILIYNKDGTFPGSTPGGDPPGPPAPPTILQGDCDGDGALTEVDALCALEMSVQLRPVSLLVDMDKSGDVTSRDAVLILQKAIYKFTE